MAATQTTDTHSMTYWAETREAAEASVAVEIARMSGLLVSRTIVADGGKFRVEVAYTTPAAFSGKTAYIEHVYDVPQESGEENYTLWTHDNHVAGSFASAKAARDWAKKNGVVSVEAKVRRVSGGVLASRRGSIQAGQHLGNQF